ncbi:hypothetical protein [Actinomadura chibensis]|uniref:GerMN domain-containing protein n=1 Tax=Actinomadura chibensis TaxID=392828 RepID=A0A5D0NGS7_9ACTN|nr:hypothetical protein [Actinomadura chibensis]TYB43600.1 hypothetical protein FXF69_27850 [Actinomadura chibensis]
MRRRPWTLTRPRKALALLVAAAALAAVAARVVPAPGGLGVQPTGIIGAGSPPVAAGKAATITVYLVRGGMLVPVVRPGLPGQPYLSIAQLRVPATSAERRKGLRTTVPPDREIVVRPGGPPGDLIVDLTVATGRTAAGARLTERELGWPRTALAQLACTAQTVPGVKRVVLVATGNDEVIRPWKVLVCGEFADLLG